MTVSSFAADAPNIVGTWKAISGVSSTTGTELKKAPPVLSQQPWHSEINITEQKALSRILAIHSLRADYHGQNAIVLF